MWINQKETEKDIDSSNPDEDDQEEKNTTRIATSALSSSVSSNCSSYAVSPVSQSTPVRPALGKKMKNKLSLSAYRKPETAIRFTNAPRDKYLENDYEIDHQVVLGHGASSTVRLGRHRKTEEKVAIKCIAKHDVLVRRRRQDRRSFMMEEYEILWSIRNSHTNIVNLIDVYETETEVQLILEYCSGGELFALIPQSSRKKRRRNSSASCISLQHADFSEIQAARIVSQLLSALAHLHKRNIVHRDVKPENILISTNEGDDDFVEVKLSDFGLARALSTSNSFDDEEEDDVSFLTSPLSSARSRAYSRVGSDYYTAPEVLTGNGYDTAVDIYSLGVTLYILLSGHPPSIKTHLSPSESILDAYSSASDYTDDEDSQVHSSTNDLMVEFPPTHWSHISASAKNLLKKMLNPHPSKRISAADALQHEWILQHVCFHSSNSEHTNTTFPLTPFVSTFDPRINYNYLATRLFPSTHANSNKRQRRRRRSSSIISNKDICTFPSMPRPQNMVTQASRP